jgi:hypothetical protein
MSNYTHRLWRVGFFRPSQGTRCSNRTDLRLNDPLLAEARPPVSYYTSIPPPTEDQYWARTRNLDAPRLRDIRKRLEAPAQQVSQAEIDDLGTELLDDIVPLASDYIGNVIVQKLFEKSSSGMRVGHGALAELDGREKGEKPCADTCASGSARHARTGCPFLGVYSMPQERDMGGAKDHVRVIGRKGESNGGC